MPGLLLIVFLASLATSFLMSGMEAGVFTLSRLRIRRLMRQGNRRAALLNGYLNHPEHFLWTILVGNTLANVLAVCIGFVALARWLAAWPLAFWLLFVVCGALFYTLLELLPKMLFRHHPHRLCLSLAPLFRGITVGLKPLVAVMSYFAQALLRWSGGRKFTGQLFGNRDELRQVMQDSAHTLSSEERLMISRVLDLEHMTLQQIALPLEQVVSVAGEASVRDALALCRERGVTRLPVWRNLAGRRRIVGLISLKSLLYREDLDLEKQAVDYLKPALFLDEGLRLEAALRQMQRTGHRLAIVLGPDRREVGLVSLEDILKVIFGEVKL